MNHKKSYTLAQAGLWGGVAVALLGLGFDHVAGNVISVLGALAMFAGIGQSFVFYRCPACSQLLNIRTRRPAYCPHCGHELDP